MLAYNAGHGESEQQGSRNWVSYTLVTNDDGARGIVALASAMRAPGEVRVIAPATNQSASGHKKTLFQDLPVAATLMPVTETDNILAQPCAA